MKNKSLDLKQQYDALSQEFSLHHSDYNKKSNDAYWKYLDTQNLKGKSILDLGCGDGLEMELFRKKSAEVRGIDSSVELVNLAKEKNHDVVVGDIESLPYNNNSFDYVVSKYVIQTLFHTEKVFQEVHRVLKRGGMFYFLVVHPFRQFIEKKDRFANYFEQTVVQSIIFDGNVVVEEPTHTIQDYLSSFVLEKFNLVVYNEGEDFISAERVGLQTYPTYLIIGLRKK